MFRSYAIVPAAGGSARMGAPKLLLPIGGQSIMARVLSAWTASRATRTIVVVRPDDARLAAICRACDVDVVVPSAAPVDMKQSVQLAIEQIAATYRPRASDAWLLAPADMPWLKPAAIDAVVAAYDPGNPCAVAPTFAGRRGHPLLLPWQVASDVARLQAGAGVNSIAARMPVCDVPWPDASILQDLDTPADVARLEAEGLCRVASD